MCDSSSVSVIVMVLFGAIFPSVVQIFCLIGAFWCEFSTGLVRLTETETGNILYSLGQDGHDLSNYV